MTTEDIVARFDEGSRQFAEMRKQLDDVLKALEPLPQMRTDIQTAKDDSAQVKELVEAWNAVKTGGKFVRWIAPLMGGLAGGWAAIKFGIRGLFP